MIENARLGSNLSTEFLHDLEMTFPNLGDVCMEKHQELKECVHDRHDQ